MWMPTQEDVDRFDAACKEHAGKVLNEARAMAEQIGISAELFACSECAPSHRDYERPNAARCDIAAPSNCWLR
jgi:hypothetical protein